MSSISQQASSSLTGSPPSSSSSDYSSLSGLASSSTFASESASSTTVSDDGGGMPAVSRSSSLLFGFLVTFLALFVGFMACGYSSRRAAHIRNARDVTQLRNMEYISPVNMKKPRLWDIWVDEGVREDRWKDMMPLSASFVRPGDEKKQQVASSNQAPSHLPLHEPFPRHEYLSSFVLGSRAFARFSHPLPPPPSPGRPRRNTPPDLDPPNNPNMFSLSRFVPALPTRLRSLFTNRNRTSGESNATPARDKDTEEDKMKNTHAQISVIIAMPSPISSSPSRLSKRGSDDGTGIFEESRHEELGDYEIGVTRIPIILLSVQSTPRQR